MTPEMSKNYILRYLIGLNIVFLATALSGGVYFMQPGTGKVAYFIFLTVLLLLFAAGVVLYLMKFRGTSEARNSSLQAENSDQKKDQERLEKAQNELKDMLLQFEFIYENMPAIIVFKRIPDLIYMDVNPATCRMLRKNRDEIIGHDDSTVFPNPADWKNFKEADSYAFTLDHPYENIMEFTDADGIVHTGRFFRKVMEMSNGEKQLFILVFDITELESSKRVIEKTNQLWNTVINALPILFFVKDVDDDYRYLLGNQSFSEFSGYALGDLSGKTDFDIFKPDEAMHFREDDAKIVARGETLVFVEAVAGGGGKLRQMKTTKQPFVANDGQRLLIGASVDVTRETELLQNERLISATLEAIAVTQNYQESVGIVAEKLLQQMQCDRVHVIRWPDKDSAFEVEFECDADGTFPSPHVPQEEVTEFLCSIRKDLEENKIVRQKWDKEQSFPLIFEHQGLKKTVIAPIFVNGKLYGILGAAYFNMHLYSEQDENCMRSMANIIALAQIREQQMLEIQQSYREKQMILNTIRIPIWLFDSAGELLRVNTAVYDINGIEVKDDAEKNITGDLNLTDSTILQVINTGKPEQAEISLNGKDYIVYAEPVRAQSGKMVNIVKYAIDVTELNVLTQNEHVLNECMKVLLSMENLDEAFNMALGMIRVHMDATWCYILRHHKETGSVDIPYQSNEPGMTLPDYCDIRLNPDSIGYRRLLNREILAYSDLSLEEYLEEILEWKDFVKNGEMRSEINCGIFIEGKLWGNISVAYRNRKHVSSTADKKFMQAVGYLSELALNLKRSREQILTALQQAQDASKAKSFFLASMSHEIRTPLNAIIGFSELLKDTSLDAETQQNYLNCVATSGNALLDMINDVLDLSKLEAGQMVFTPVKTDFSALCRMMSEIFMPKITAKKLHQEIDVQPMPEIYIDSQRVRQVLFNLMGNAVKFTDSGSLKLSAAFTPEKDGRGTLVFQVADTGPGIDPEDQKRLFEVFVQSKRMRGTYAANQGTGLGLAICRRMLERMNGKIEVKSEFGKGSTFIVTLHEISYETTGRNDFNRPLAACETPNDSPVTTTVIIVDDVALNIRVLSAMMKKFGVDVIEANSSAEVLQLLKTRSVDMVFTDLWMPEMNGAELAGQIRKIHPELPIYATTADVESSETFDMHVFTGIITKPISYEKLHAIFAGKQNLPSGKS